VNASKQSGFGTEDDDDDDDDEESVSEPASRISPPSSMMIDT
jgi:hypothetical protein